jgi:glycosyltransferase involved in cell wall biosynthesis
VPSALRIGIDISRTLGESSGVGRYAEELVRGLATIDRDNQYLLYPRFWECAPPDIQSARVPPGDNFRVFVPRDLERGWRSWLVGKERSIGAPDVVHSTAYTAPRLRRARLVVSVHDLSVVSHPQFHTEANLAFCLRHLAVAAHQAARILVPTQATRQALQSAYRIEDERIEVIPYAAAADFAPLVDSASVRPLLDGYGITTPFVLFVGSLEPRKNVDTLMRALARVVRDDRIANHQLVIAGPAGWLNQPTHRLIDELELRSRLRFTGYVSNAALRALYSAADVFVYPSFLEGFGLPVLEAMACGAPVITSATPALTEVAGDAALLVDPHDVAALSTALLAALTNDELRARLRRQSLQRAACFSWQDTARRTLAVYQSVA